jgi:hypothetical protein
MRIDIREEITRILDMFLHFASLQSIDTKLGEFATLPGTLVGKT